MPAHALEESFQANPNGFTVAHGGQLQEFQDADVVGIRLETRRESDFAGSTHLSQSLHLRIADATDTSWVTVQHENGPLDEDGLGGFRRRVLENLAGRAWARLERGEEVRGEGWTLSLIFFTDHDSGESCFLQQVAAVRWDGDELCLWHEDFDEPFGRYPREAENTLLLARLLEFVLGKATAPSSAPLGLGLGEQLAQISIRRPPPAVNARLAIAGGLMLAALFLCLPLYVLGVVVVLTLMVLVAISPLLRGSVETFTHYERGYVWSHGCDERVILCDHLAGLMVDWRLPQPSQPGDPNFARIQLESLDRDEPPIDFTLPLDDDRRRHLESLQTHAAAVIAERMQRELEESGQTRWTATWTITRGGLIEKRHPTAADRSYGFADFARSETSYRQLTIWQKDGQTPIVVAAKQRNFYPGLMLLQMRENLP